MATNCAAGSFECKHSSTKHGLAIAASQGHLQCLKQLLTEGADVNETYYDRNTPISLAALHGHESCVQALIEAGADVNKTESRSTALECAAVNGFFKSQQDCAMTGHSDCIHASDVPLNITKLFWESRVRIVEMLLKAGAKWSAENEESFSKSWRELKWCSNAMIKAQEKINSAFGTGSKPGENLTKLLLDYVRNRNYSRIEFLLSKLDPTDAAWSSALNWAAHEKDDYGVGMMTNAGVGCTETLFRAIGQGNLPYVDALIKGGADLNASFGNQSFLHQALKANKGKAVIKYLLRGGIHLNLRNDIGQTALEEHIAEGHRGNPMDRESMKLLLIAGEKNFDFVKGRDGHISYYRIRVPRYCELPKNTDVSLLSICRQAVRKHVIELGKPLNLFVKVHQVGLPSRLCEYLLYDVSLPELEYPLEKCPLKMEKSPAKPCKIDAEQQKIAEIAAATKKREAEDAAATKRREALIQRFRRKNDEEEEEDEESDEEDEDSDEEDEEEEEDTDFYDSDSDSVKKDRRDMNMTREEYHSWLHSMDEDGGYAYEHGFHDQEKIVDY